MILGDTPSGALVFMQYYMSPMDEPMERSHRMMVSPYEEAPIEAVQGCDYELTGEGNVGMPQCRCVAYQANTRVG